ncbi:hypothetical protein BH09GEM1_BH09GEM1_16260 [soil metagenome]
MHPTPPLSLLIVVALGSACGMSARVPPDPSTRPPEVVVPAADTASETVVVQTNAERRKLGLPELARSNMLMRAAQLQADQMAEALTTAHDLPRARYPTIDDRLRAVGYTMRATGENVAGGYPGAASVVAGWMTSSGHRANIVSPHYTDMGAGVATGKNGRRYWAQVFGAPR